METIMTISSTAFSVFDEARLLGEHTDMIIRANGAEFQVHKIIMCGCSAYFRALFSTSWARTAEPLYEIPEMSRELLSSVIQFAYTGSALITEENVLEILVEADKLLIWGLVKACCEFLEAQLCPENCIGISTFTGLFHSCSKLHNKAKLYVLRHFEEILQVSEEFLELPLEQLEQIIDEDELNVKQEEVVFEAILHWIHHAPENRRNHIATLLPKVRMGLMTSEYFMSNVRLNPLVKENEACAPFILNAMKTVLDLDRPSSSTPLNQRRPRLPPAILLAIGGWNDGHPTNGIEAYNTKLDRWVPVGVEDERPRAYLGAAALEEFVYCIGGYDNGEYFNSVRKFNLITQTWHEVAPMNERRCYVSVAVLDGLIYSIGGYNGHRRLKSAERYNPNTNQWTATAQMNERRSDASATSLQGRVYICGGFTGTDCLFTAESFNPETNQWTLIAPMRSRRSGVGVVTYGDLVYAVGGFDGVSRLRSVETYDPQTNVWTEAASMTHPRSNFGIEVIDDQLYAIGGFDGDDTISDVECYDMLTEEWYAAHKMGILRSALGCCVASGLPNMLQYTVQPEPEQIQEQEQTHSQ